LIESGEVFSVCAGGVAVGSRKAGKHRFEDRKNLEQQLAAVI
jgi:hypothetical protein